MHFSPVSKPKSFKSIFVTKFFHLLVVSTPALHQTQCGASVRPSANTQGYSTTGYYPPYGTQIFFTCVECLKISSISGSSPLADIAQVCFMFPAEAACTAFLPSVEPAYQITSTSSCSERVFANSSRFPVTMLN